MITISTIGSAIVKEIVSNLPKNHYVVKENYLSISPLSFINLNCKTDIVLPKGNAESYQDDINKTVVQKIKDNLPDYLIMDLLDFRLSIGKYKNDLTEFTATKNNGFLNVIKNSNFKEVETINPFDLSLDELKTIVKLFFDRLIDIIPPERIIIFDVRSADIYLSLNHKVYNLLETSCANRLNQFYNQLYILAKLVAPKCVYIPGPDFYYHEEQKGQKLFSFKLQKYYYDYAIKALNSFFGNKAGEVKKLCQECQALSIAEIEKYDKREKKWESIELKSFCGIYEDDFGNKINTNGIKIDIVLNGVNNKIDVCKAIFCKNIKIKVGNNNTLLIKDNSKINSVSIDMQNNNYFITGEALEADDLKISLKGSSKCSIGYNNKFKDKSVIIINSGNFCIGNNCNVLGMDAYLFSKAEVEIGNNLLLSKQFVLSCHSFTKTTILDDSIFATEIEIINGDGHSIFDINTQKKTNDMRNGKNEIVIEKHVWVGRRCLILSNTLLGEGSIVAAGSITKNHYPNNCLIAGVPAAIKKKNITWCRDNETQEFEKCEPYTRKTEE